MQTPIQLVSIRLFLGIFLGSFSWLAQAASEDAKPQAEQKPPAVAAGGKQEPFYLHGVHVKQLGLDCSTCHTPAKEGSVALQRPGHDQCMTCHQDAFGDNLNQKICSQCHTEFPPTSAEQLLPFPRYKGARPLLVEFSHAQHLDPNHRIDKRTGYRADCSFCHQLSAKGIFSTGHEQCAACHSKTGMKPLLSPASTTSDCQACHHPTEIENPTLVATRKPFQKYVVSGKYQDISFSHQTHFQNASHFDMNCTVCHSAILNSASLQSLDLPKMSQCASCHSQQMVAAHRMDQCGTCHVSQDTGKPILSYSRWIKPAFHTESFRTTHMEMASEPGANCYACHAGVAAEGPVRNRCNSCHQTIRPASHTARWRDDVHGKMAALDRTKCEVCHTADTCVRCHNETPRSHEPLPYFKGGAHARLAMLNERSCLTCHTFENTCAECHAR